MEQEEDYKRVLALRNELKYQLSTLHCVTKDDEAALAIESHFNFCMNALAARKTTLLQELDIKIAQKNRKILETQKELEGFIESCNRILNTGAQVYRSNKEGASAVWKNVHTLPEVRVIEEKIQVTFHPAFLGTIASYGAVYSTPASTTCSAGSVTTLAGSVQGKVDGYGSHARMNGPRGICFNPIDHCLYVCDSHNHVVRKISPEGLTTSITITNPNQVVEHSAPFGIAHFQRDNCLYVTDKGYHSIKKINPSGKVEHFAGSGTEGRRDGTGGYASFSYPYGIAVDQRSGNIFVAETGSNCIRMITPNAIVTTIAGPGIPGNRKGIFTEFNYPTGLFYSDLFKRLFVCDYSNNKLRTICPATGEVLTVPCDVYRPSSVAVASNGTILVTSLLGHKILAINQVNGKYVSTVIAGTDAPGKQDGAPKYSSFNSPSGIALDERTNTCFVSESENHDVRKFALLYQYQEVVARTGYKERWKEFFSVLDTNNNGLIDPADFVGSNKLTRGLAKFWRAPELSEKVQKSVAGMKYVTTCFIQGINTGTSVLSLPDLLSGVERLFVGRTPATMPIWWRETVKHFFTMNDLDENGELTYAEFHTSIKSSTPDESDEKIRAAYTWAQALSPTGRFDITAAMVVTFIWATSPEPEPEVVLILPFWRRSSSP